MRSNVLSDELKGDEDLPNKLKSSDQANMSDEQEFNTENTHFKENAKATQVTEEFGTLKKDIATNKSEFSDATEEPASISRSMPVRAVKSCFQVIQQLLEEMNSDTAASEATELDHKKTFEELSDTKNEEIATNPPSNTRRKASKHRRRNSRTIVRIGKD